MEIAKRFTHASEVGKVDGFTVVDNEAHAIDHKTPGAYTATLTPPRS